MPLLLTPSELTRRIIIATETRNEMDSDPTKEGIFQDHRCWKCQDGDLPCKNGNPRQCDYPRARND